MFEINSNIKVEIVKCKNNIVFIIDNFYKNPDKIREYAIKSKKYSKNDNEDLLYNVLGRRVCEDDQRLSYYMKNVFGQLCQHNEWNIEFDEKHHEYKWSGMRFMVNVANNQEIVLDNREHIEHSDGPLNKWACVVYLNTEDECEGGTEFYEWSGNPNDWPKLEYTAQMKYNRSVLYNANHIHGACMKKNMFKTCDRLVQVMFM